MNSKEKGAVLIVIWLLFITFIVVGIISICNSTPVSAETRGQNTEKDIETRYFYREITVPVEVEVEKEVIVVETEIITETIIEEVVIFPDDYYAYEAAIEAHNKKIQEHWDYCASKYPVATQVWRTLTEDYGLPEKVVAGIMGNMMNECGGNTLNLHWNEYGSNGGFYGLCQWSMKYHSNLGGISIEDQLGYLMHSIEGMFKTWGKNYLVNKKNCTYEMFLDLGIESSAEAFMKVYERCGTGSLEKRKNNAKKAYEFFVLADEPIEIIYSEGAN